MSGLHDSFTVGIILLIVLGAVFFYFYTRLGQIEKRMKLLETILLDLKVATENSFIEFPSGAVAGAAGTGITADDDDADTDADDEADGADAAAATAATAATAVAATAATTTMPVTDSEEIPAEAVPTTQPVTEVVAEPLIVDIPVASQPTDTYEYMSLKELVAVAKQRGMTGIHKLKRPELLKLLRESEKAFGGDVSVESVAAPAPAPAPEASEGPEGLSGEEIGEVDIFGQMATVE
jgi:hypothetical protein